MKTVPEIRQQMAESGYELTPGECDFIVKKIKKLNRRFRKCPELDYLSPEDKHELLNELAERGMEVNMNELEDYLEIACRIRDLDM